MTETEVPVPPISHPNLAIGDRVIDLLRPDEFYTIQGYDGARKLLFLLSDSGLPLICPAKWFARLYSETRIF